jgi:branched-chain amino acid transport system substrate-binding protein
MAGNCPQQTEAALGPLAAYRGFLLRGWGNGRIDELRINRVSVLAAAAMLPLGLTACGVIGSQADTSPVVIGADLELSGANAAIGVAYKQALQLEIDQINAAGGAGGHPLRLDALDNRTDPQVSVTNIAKLAAEPDLGTIVTGSCGMCLAAEAKTLEEKKIPTISLASIDLSSLGSAAADWKYLFKLNPNPEDDADLLAAELKSDPANPVHKYAVLATDDKYGELMATDVKAQAQKGGASEVSSQRIKATETTSGALSSPVHQAVARDPDALVISALPAQAAQVAVAARDAGFVGQMYFDAIAAGDLFQPTATSPATDGITMIAPQSLVIDDVIATSPAQTSRKEWFNAYTSKYANFSAYSLYAADAVQVIASAITSSDGADHERLRNVIEDIQLEGFSGPLRFTPDNHSGLTPQALTTVTGSNGRWHLATG